MQLKTEKHANLWTVTCISLNASLMNFNGISKIAGEI